MYAFNGQVLPNCCLWLYLGTNIQHSFPKTRRVVHNKYFSFRILLIHLIHQSLLLYQQQLKWTLSHRHSNSFWNPYGDPWHCQTLPAWPFGLWSCSFLRIFQKKSFQYLRSQEKFDNGKEFLWLSKWHISLNNDIQKQIPIGLFWLVSLAFCSQNIKGKPKQQPWSEPTQTGHCQNSLVLPNQHVVCALLHQHISALHIDHGIVLVIGSHHGSWS